MDFGAVKHKFDKRQYETVHDFVSDVLLVFNNSKTFNKPTTIIYKDGEALRKMFYEQCITQLKDTSSSTTTPVVSTLTPNPVPKRSMWSVNNTKHRQLVNEIKDEVRRDIMTDIIVTAAKGHAANISPSPRRIKRRSETSDRPDRDIHKRSRSTDKPKEKKKSLFKSTRRLTSEEKIKLAERTNLLTQAQLDVVLKIVTRYKPEIDPVDGTLELDLDTLSDAAQKRIKQYVDSCLLTTSIEEEAKTPQPLNIEQLTTTEKEENSSSSDSSGSED